MNKVNPGFLGVNPDKREIDAVVVGCPFDSGVSWRPGTRMGPQAIRDASLNIETYSYRYSKDAAELRIEDLGDVSVVHGDSAATIGRTKDAIDEIRSQSDAPVMLIGGEHTATIASVRALKPDVFVVFDAHTDMRDEYMGFNLSHATVSRRITEILGPNRIIQVGMRASSKEELEFVKTNDIKLISCISIHTNGTKKAAEELTEAVGSAMSIYVSIDLDVLDPSCMPGVGNPEAEGLYTRELIELIDPLVDGRLVGFDLMELNPMVDSSGVSAVTAARIATEILTKCAISRS